MEHDRAVGRAAHARIGDAHHVGDALAQNLRRQGHVPDFRHPGISARAAVLKHHDAVFVDVERFVVDAGVEIFDRLENNGTSAMLQQIAGWPPTA